MVMLLQVYVYELKQTVWALCDGETAAVYSVDPTDELPSTIEYDDITLATATCDELTIKMFDTNIYTQLMRDCRHRLCNEICSMV